MTRDGDDSSLICSGVRIDVLTQDAAVHAVLHSPESLTVHLCNAYTLAVADRDAGFRERLNRGSLNLMDGMPLVWLARRAGFRSAERVYGPELMRAALDQSQTVGTRHFLWGSTEHVLGALEASIRSQWPSAVICGSASPPFRPLTDNDIAEAVATFDRHRADVVWVGMGTPQQDELVERLAAIGSHRFVAVGAAFDFIAGTKPQAPVVLQRTGLEWLFRLMSEPKRLWRRYLLGNSRFIWSVIRQPPMRAR